MDESSYILHAHKRILVSNGDTTKCCLCMRKINGYGNNPAPLFWSNEVNHYICCNDCDDYFVVKSRLLFNEEKRDIIYSISPGSGIYLPRDWTSGGDEISNHFLKFFTLSFPYNSGYIIDDSIVEDTEDLAILSKIESLISRYKENIVWQSLEEELFEFLDNLFHERAMKKLEMNKKVFSAGQI